MPIPRSPSGGPDQRPPSCPLGSAFPSPFYDGLYPTLAILSAPAEGIAISRWAPPPPAALPPALRGGGVTWMVGRDPTPPLSSLPFSPRPPFSHGMRLSGPCRPVPGPDALRRLPPVPPPGPRLPRRQRPFRYPPPLLEGVRGGGSLGLPDRFGHR